MTNFPARLADRLSQTHILAAIVAATAVQIYAVVHPATVTAAQIIVGAYTAIAVLATLACVVAARRGSGLERRVWRLLAIGLTSWSLGGVSYIAFLATGGTPDAPAVWSQIGYLIAYPFWVAAFWKLRQPVIAATLARRLETLAIEIAALVMLATVIGSLLWNPALPPGQNIAQLIPAALDVLLFAAFYNAIRRSSLNHQSAHLWLGIAFGLLATTDVAVSYFAVRGDFVTAGFALLGYPATMGLLAMAALRPLRVASAQEVLGSSTTVIGSLALGLSVFASTVVPSDGRPVVWAIAALLFWRVSAGLHDRERSDHDPQTGFLTAAAFNNHVAGLLRDATQETTATVIAVDLNDFGAWNARNGFRAGDEMIARTAAALDAQGLARGLWGRLGPDCFAIAYRGPAGQAARDLAYQLVNVAEAAAADLSARAGLVELPTDAATPAQALAAIQEALGAARSSKRRLVAYDHGNLEGLEALPGVASMAERRERITQIMAEEHIIRSVYQPIVRLDDLSILGFEALTRFDTEPRRGPDRWIAEAHAVGLGVDLELECLRRSIARRHEAPDQATLTINASVATVMSDRLLGLIGDQPLDWLVIEITEHDEVDNYAQLAARLARFRGLGARVAIDDAGAGHSSLRHVMQLKPEIVKLDRSLIMNIDSDLGKQALVRSLVTFKRDIGAILVAEGVETALELAALRRLDVDCAQGYLFARPEGRFRRRVEAVDAAPAL